MLGRTTAYFNDDEVNAAIDKAFLIADDAAREKAWADLDEMIAKKGGSVAMGQQKFTFMWGSSVKNFSSNPSIGGLPGPCPGRRQVAARRAGQRTNAGVLPALRAGHQPRQPQQLTEGR